MLRSLPVVGDTDTLNIPSDDIAAYNTIFLWTHPPCRNPRRQPDPPPTIHPPRPAPSRPRSFPRPSRLGRKRTTPMRPLRLPNYRRYFIGNAFSLIGAQMTTYTVAYEIYQRTGSALALGMVGLVQVIPIILFALPSGYLIDRFSRKKLILFATAVQICLWIMMGLSSRFSDQLFPGLGKFSGFADAHVPVLY